MTTVLQVLIEHLKKWNVTHIFGIPGRPVGPLIKEAASQGITFVLTQHETGAGYAAGGFATQKNTLGVALATAGPGGTNMITAAGQAMAHHAPVLFLTGQMSAGKIGRSYSQDSSSFGIDLAKLFEPVTKYSARVERGDAFESHLRHAVEKAFSGVKGPVHLSLPLDVLFEEINPFEISLPQVPHTIAANLNEAADIIKEARRPVLLLGKGIRSSNSYKEIFAFATSWGIPVITTGGGKGTFPTTHPLSLGVYGLGGTIEAEQYLKSKVDVMIIAGSSLNDMALAGFKEDFYPEKVVHFDYDLTFVGKAIPRPTLFVPGDLKANLRKLLDLEISSGVLDCDESKRHLVDEDGGWVLQNGGSAALEVAAAVEGFDYSSSWDEWRGHKIMEMKAEEQSEVEMQQSAGVAVAKRNFTDNRAKQGSEQNAVAESIKAQKDSHPTHSLSQASPKDIHTERAPFMSSVTAIHAIRKSLPNHTKVFADVGSHAYYAVKHFDIYLPGTFFFDDKFIAMGNGIGYAVGAKIADNDDNQDQPVACITGDGCMLMHGTELVTAKEHQAAILFYVFNNGSLDMVETGMKHWLKHEGLFVYNKPIDFVSFAKAFGCEGFRCTNEEDIEKATEYGLQSTLPTIIEIMVDPNEIPPTLKREE